MIKAVVFDVGGVLAYDVWEHLFVDKKHGIPSICNLIEDDLKIAGSELWEEFAYLPEKQPDDWKRLEEDYWNKFITRFGLSQLPSTFIEMTPKFIKAVEGMIPLLEILQSKGVDLAICSNNNEFWFRAVFDCIYQASRSEYKR